ncbi:hypothetical protein D3C73_1124650 [compost metagenome]
MAQLRKGILRLRHNGPVNDLSVLFLPHGRLDTVCAEYRVEARRPGRRRRTGQAVRVIFAVTIRIFFCERINSLLKLIQRLRKLGDTKFVEPVLAPQHRKIVRLQIDEHWNSPQLVAKRYSLEQCLRLFDVFIVFRHLLFHHVRVDIHKHTLRLVSGYI